MHSWQLPHRMSLSLSLSHSLTSRKVDKRLSHRASLNKPFHKYFTLEKKKKAIYSFAVVIPIGSSLHFSFSSFELNLFGESFFRLSISNATTLNFVKPIIQCTQLHLTSFLTAKLYIYELHFYFVVIDKRHFMLIVLACILA